jgi:endo-1,4-beta-xylanase
MKKYSATRKFILLSACSLFAACSATKLQETQKTNPCTQNTKLSGGTIFTGNSGGNVPLSGSPYGYEMWTEGGNNNRMIWYGANQGGGAAFRAEWNNARDFLGRVGYFWNQDKPYTDYKNVYCDFNFTRSANGTGGNYSYIGIYGWSKNPMIEWYIVDDWFGDGIIGPSIMGNGATKVGEFTVDGATYFVYQATRPAGSGNIENSNNPFTQFFSIRQTRRQCGTISVTKHFKEWENLGMKLGSNMWEAKFLVEAGGGTGWFDASYLSFYQK